MIKRLLDGFSVFLKNKKGATMVEYGIIVALIATVSVAVITQVGTDIKATFTQLDAKITGTSTTTP